MKGVVCSVSRDSGHPAAQQDAVGVVIDLHGGSRAMMEVHICNRSGSLLKAFAVGDAEEVIIGRDEGCDIQIDARSVSREHCCIECDGEEMYLRDLGSSGGTMFNGTPVDRLRLQDGMEIIVGPARLKFFESGI